MTKEKGTAQPNTNQTNAGSRGIPPAVYQFLAAAEVLDDAIRLGHTDVLGSSHQPARQQKEAAIVASNLPLSIPATKPPFGAVSAANDRPTDEMADELTALFAAVQAIYDATATR
jgi:hypothetical protein